MKTKALVRFLNRAARFDGDVEFVDVVAAAVAAGDLTPRGRGLLFAHVNSSKHPRLSSQAASRHNQQIVTAHLKATVYAAYIKDIYEDMSAYFADVLKAAASNGLDPGRLIGDHKFSVEANDILKCGTWEKVLDLVSQSLFRKLEDERSTMKLLEKIDNKLGLKVNKKVIDDALPYLEIRHLLVHQDGVPDSQFIRSHPKIGLVAGTRMALTHDLVHTARRTITILVTHYDEKVIAGKCVGNEDLQP